MNSLPAQACVRLALPITATTCTSTSNYQGGAGHYDSLWVFGSELPATALLIEAGRGGDSSGLDIHRSGTYLEDWKPR